MVEGEESGWLSELEKKGLHQAAEILENYGINSETDVSVIDRDDFCKLVSGDSCTDCGDENRIHVLPDFD